MLICIYIRRTKCFYCVVYFVLFGRHSYFYVVFYRFVFILLLNDINMFDVLYDMLVALVALCHLSFVNKYQNLTVYHIL